MLFVLVLEAAYQFLISYSQYNFSSPLGLCAAGSNTSAALQWRAFLTTPGERRVPKRRVLLVSRSLSPTSFLGDKMKFIFPIPQGAEHSGHCRNSQLKQQEWFVQRDVNATAMLWIFAKSLFSCPVVNTCVSGQAATQLSPLTQGRQWEHVGTGQRFPFWHHCTG